MKRVFKILLKIVLILLAVLVVAGVILKLSFNDPVPQGATGAKADELAYNILNAIKHKEFKQAQEIYWTFRGVNSYRWKPQQNLVDVYWGDYRVAYQTHFPEISFAFKGTQRLEGTERQEAIDYAFKNFNNDSFWLVAPHKLFDAGTTRQLIREDGIEKLLVTYTSGGSTPGDSYLWEVNEQFIPISCKMWVGIIPLDGFKTTWTDWQMTAGNFPLPGKRSMYGLDIPITDVKVVN